MNNLTSLQYFIPELLLSLIAFFLLITDEIANPRIRRLNCWIICCGIVISLIATIYFLYDPPRAILCNFLQTSPTRNLFRILLFLTFLLFFITDFRSSHQESPESSLLFQKTIIVLGAALILVANSCITLLLAIGLIGAATISLILSSSRIPSSDSIIQAYISIILLNFATFLFAFSLILAFTGSLAFDIIPQKLHLFDDSPIILSFLMLAIIASFGLPLGIFPFQFTHYKISNILPSTLSLFILFIPAIAYTGIFMEMCNLIFSSLAPTSSIIIVFSLLTCLAGNIQLYNKKQLKEIITDILIVHSGLIFLGIGLNTRFSFLAVIYLTASTTIIVSGLYSCRMLLPDWRKLNYLFITIFMLGLMGFPGTSGFAARFLLMKAIIQFPLHYPLILITLVTMIPPVFATVSFILESRQKILESAAPNASFKSILLPAVHVIALIILGLSWEPCIKVIDRALVFLQFRL